MKTMSELSLTILTSSVPTSLVSSSIVLSYLVLFAPIVTSIKCRICDHHDVSFTPTDQPNTRFVFNLESANCSESTLECVPEENFCLFAYAKTHRRRYWLQKGCVSADSRSRFSQMRDRTDGCLTEWLDAYRIRSWPISSSSSGGGRGSMQLRVCLCRGEDECNRGSLDIFVASTAAGRADRWDLGLLVMVAVMMAMIKLW